MLEMVELSPNWKENIITGDETWVHRYNLETKRQSIEWKGKEKPRTKKSKSLQVNNQDSLLSNKFEDKNLTVFYEAANIHNEQRVKCYFLRDIFGGDPGKFKTALRRSFRLQDLQPQYGFEDLPSSTKMVTTEASGTSEVFGANSGQQSYAFHIPRNPPTFSGESAQDPQKWIKMFERVAKYNKWDETQSLANVVFYLEGTAAQWFDNNEDIINSWTQFKTDLCEVFGQKEELTRQAEMTLKARAQKPGDNRILHSRNPITVLPS
ncbi:hypothetical protein LAZ67_4002440 [Cordylochernes scorpioides]|uniref:Retrotransposon gag domain-containing protein n=1 Tax=Cordylochernes scorpioides TaxID=51811 RepID=A0ABY6KFU7_9ARAC|nr:hypothetical protein LAZ67_4002440 [Cordylochernes scorpioides]